MIKNKSRLQILILVCLNYFTFALITNIPGALLPYWKDAFHLNATSISLLGSAFFLAYGLTSLPQGVLLDNLGNKKTFIWGMSLIFLGSVTFALIPKYEVGLISIFIMGVGVTALQLVGNLLVKKIDEDPNKYSRNLTLTQIFCGVGGLGGGFLIGFLIKDMGFEWQSIYYIFAGLGTLLALYALSINIPETEKDSNYKKPNFQEYFKLVKNPLMMLFAGGIFIYVGIEVGVATWIATFLIENHHFNKVAAIGIVGLYWGFQSIGRFSGGFVLNFLDTSKALIIYSLSSLGSLLIAALVPSGQIAAIAFISVGFFTSIMFPSIFSLAVNSFDKRQEGTVAGVICAAIAGGAVVAPFIGFVSDVTKSLSFSLVLAGAISFLYIGFIGLHTLRKQSALESSKEFYNKIKTSAKHETKSAEKEITKI